jgi:hypothetical protein
MINVNGGTIYSGKNFRYANGAFRSILILNARFFPTGL